jgi:hypothetical protein
MLLFCLYFCSSVVQHLPYMISTDFVDINFRVNICECVVFILKKWLSSVGYKVHYMC